MRVFRNIEIAVSKFIEYIAKKLFEQDGVTYGANSMSVSSDWLKNNPKTQEISRAIQDTWNKNVDKDGVQKLSKDTQRTESGL